jgi:hypothetical protein
LVAKATRPAPHLGAEEPHAKRQDRRITQCHQRWTRSPALPRRRLQRGRYAGYLDRDLVRGLSAGDPTVGVLARPRGGPPPTRGWAARSGIGPAVVGQRRAGQLVRVLAAAARGSDPARARRCRPRDEDGAALPGWASGPRTARAPAELESARARGRFARLDSFETGARSPDLGHLTWLDRAPRRRDLAALDLRRGEVVEHGRVGVVVRSAACSWLMRAMLTNTASRSWSFRDSSSVRRASASAIVSCTVTVRAPSLRRSSRVSALRRSLVAWLLTMAAYPRSRPTIPRLDSSFASSSNRSRAGASAPGTGAVLSAVP